MVHSVPLGRTSPPPSRAFKAHECGDKEDCIAVSAQNISWGLDNHSGSYLDDVDECCAHVTEIYSDLSVGRIVDDPVRGHERSILTPAVMTGREPLEL